MPFFVPDRVGCASGISGTAALADLDAPPGPDARLSAAFPCGAPMNVNCPYVVGQ